MPGAVFGLNLGIQIQITLLRASINKLITRGRSHITVLRNHFLSVSRPPPPFGIG